MPKRRRRRWPRRIALVLLALLVLLFVVWLLRFPLFGGLIRSEIAAALREEGIEVEIGGLSGSLLADAEVTGIRIREAPYLRGHGEIDRVRASYSLLGLLSGSGDWLHEVSVEGVRGALDLEKEPPVSEEGDEEEAEEDAEPFVVGSLRVERVDVTVLSREARLDLRGGRLTASGLPGGSYYGSFGADLLEILAGDEEHRAETPHGEFRYLDRVLTVDPLLSSGETYLQVLSLDLGGLDEDRLTADLDIPLFDGRVRVRTDLDLSGDRPAGTATARIEGLDARPFLRFLPGLPLDVGRIDGRLTIADDAHAAPGIPPVERLEGTFDLRVTEAAYEGRGATRIHLEGDILSGAATLRASIADPAAELRASIDLTGSEPLLDVRLALASLDLDRLDLSAGGRKVRGHVRDVRVRARGTLSSPELDVRARVEAPAFGEHGADSVEVVVIGGPKRVRVESLVLARGEDSASASGTLHLEEPLRFESAHLDLRVTDLARYRRFLPPDAPQDLSGGLRVTADSAAGTPSAPHASVTLTGQGIRASGHGVSALTLEGVVETTENLRATFIRVQGEAPLPLTELGDVRVILGDAGPDVRAGSLRVEAYGATLRNAEGTEIVYAPDGTVAASLVVDPVDLEGLRAGLAPHLECGGSLDRVRLQLSGTVAAPFAEIRLDASALWIAPAGLPRIDVRSLGLAAGYEDGRIRLEDLSAAGEEWTGHVAGGLPLDLDDPSTLSDVELSGRLALSSVPLPLLGAIAGAPLEAGRVDASFEIGGTPSAPLASGTLTVRDGRLGPVSDGVPPVEALGAAVEVKELSPEGGTILLTSAEARVLGATLTLKDGAVVRREGRLLEPRLELELTDLALARLAQLLQTDLPVRGRVAKLQATLGDGPVLDLRLEGRELEFRDDTGLTLDLAGRFEDGAFTTSRGEVVRKNAATGTETKLVLTEARVPFELQLDPPRAGPLPGAEVLLAIESRGLDLRDVLASRGGAVRGSGPLVLALTVRGTIGEPHVQGSARITGGSLRLPSAPPIDALTGRAVFEVAPDLLRIEQLTGRLGGGEFRLDGSVMLPDRRIGAVDLALTAEDALIVREEDLRIRSDLDLRIAGTGLADLVLSGEVKLLSLRYTETVDYLEGGTSAPPLPLTEDPVLGGIRLNLVVEAPPDSIRIRNNLLDADLAGRLAVSGTIAVPRPDGRIRFLRGKLLLPTARMKVQRASIDFQPNQPLRPFLDAQTTADISGYAVVATATGPADRLRIDLASSPSLTRANIVSLLTTGAVWEKVDSRSLSSTATSVLIRRLSAHMTSRDGESSTLSEIADRLVFEYDNRRATFRLSDRFYLRGTQDDPLNFGLDLLYRVTFR